ncbi:FAD-dependent oxidoreductase [Streptomyces sp. N2-109]|uniref:FAD-dependent oxidoreductase n=1 Tax=Streptomyces gossypii TaxID=2883101 RepID=A0ABT2JZ37_9ACTN|nr:NAD(P)/FAD-dependent oxidoreductase [Streptomyces gossypii]MCT2593172.1 FAD-dependent oxidoreductase [Streptomyces gossypii]
MWASTQTGSEAAGDGPAEDHNGDVVVLGAGIAALVAAYELELLGHRVMVLEGSERIGGRVYTHRFGTADNAPHVELGAMRIPPGHELTMRYVEKLGLKSALRPFRTILSDENNYLTTGSGYVRVKNASGPLLADLRREVPTASYGSVTLLFGAWMAAVVRAMAPAELRDNLASDLTTLLRLADRVDLTPYVHGARSDRIDLGAVFREHPELRMGCGPRLYSFLDDLLLETGTGLMYLSGGMSQIAERLADRIRGPILLGREVISLDAGCDQVSLGIRHRRHRTVRQHPAVLCTLPFSVLRQLALTGFDDDKREVIGSVDYGGATKIALHCREAFWERDGTLGGASATGGRTRQTYYPPHEGDPAQGAVLLGSYAIAEDADLLGQFPEDARHAAVIDELAPLYPQLKEPGTVLGAASIAWAGHRWSNGCTSRRWRWGKDATGRDEEMRRAARPQGRLFFAGEHCSATPAWINGAIESALGAVTAIDTALRSSR